MFAGVGLAEPPCHVLNDVPHGSFDVVGSERTRHVGETVEAALQALQLHSVLSAKFLTESDVALDHGRAGIIGNAGNAPADADAVGGGRASSNGQNKVRGAPHGGNGV